MFVYIRSLRLVKIPCVLVDMVRVFIVVLLTSNKPINIILILIITKHACVFGSVHTQRTDQMNLVGPRHSALNFDLSPIITSRSLSFTSQARV